MYTYKNTKLTRLVQQNNGDDRIKPLKLNINKKIQETVTQYKKNPIFLSSESQKVKECGNGKKMKKQREKLPNSSERQIKY